MSLQIFYQELFEILSGDSTLDIKSVQLYERVERLALQTKGILVPSKRKPRKQSDAQNQFV